MESKADTNQIVILDPAEKQTLEDYIKHDLKSQLKAKPLKLTWEDHCCVIVSNYFDRAEGQKKEVHGSLKSYEAIQNEREVVARQLKEQDFEVHVEDELVWARNEFLSFGDTLIGQTGYFKDSYRSLACGANYIMGEDFIIVSSFLAESPKSRERKALINFWNILGAKRVYFVPPASKVPCQIIGGEGAQSSHLDYTIASIPWLRIFSIDEEYYREQESLFKEIERAEEFKFVKINPAAIRIPSGYTEKVNGVAKSHYYNYDLWANNGYLALCKKDRNELRKTTILYNRVLNYMADDLKSAARKNNRDNQINFVSTDVPLLSNTFVQGSLYCFTNTAPSKRLYLEFKRKLAEARSR